MIIHRKKYVDQIYSAIHNDIIKFVLLNGGRESWKTTLLREIMNDETISNKKYYVSLDDHIVSKQFTGTDDFMSYMQIKFGIDFFQQNLLLLNEIQYSKNLWSIVNDLLLNRKIKTKIIATGVTLGDFYSPINLSPQEYKIITVYPLDFFEFLEHKQIHTQYLTTDQFSPIMFKEIEKIFDEFLIRGGYPSVVIAQTHEAKLSALKQIIQKIYDKDAGFWFNTEELLNFQKILEYLVSHNTFSIKKNILSDESGISIRHIEHYIKFLTNNFIIDTIPHFFSNKRSEVSLQKKMYFIDTGIISFLTNTFWSKLKNTTTLKNFIYAEIVKNKTEKTSIKTYKKINGSHIDFLLYNTEFDSIIPVVISNTKSTISPKIYTSFWEHYKGKIPHMIKLIPMGIYKDNENNITYDCVPYFMTRELLYKYTI